MNQQDVKPKICGVCHRPLDHVGGRWLHSAEVFGLSDHESIPVDWDETQVTTMCDFCYDQVPQAQRWTVVADDFTMPIINTRSEGSWCACPPCAQLVLNRDWDGVIERYMVNHPRDRIPEMAEWLAQLFYEVQMHMHDVRPWQPGDEERT